MDPTPDTEDRFPLDDAAIELIAEMTRQIGEISAGRYTVLVYFCKQHKLDPPQWELDRNGKELVRKQPQSTIQQVPAKEQPDERSE